MVLDERAFVTFNPFSIYVTQADVKPGCVLRAANVRQALYRRGLLTDAEVSGSNDDIRAKGVKVDNDVTHVFCVILCMSLNQVNTCKNGMNTWAYVGDINDKPQLSCVYQSDDSQNEFLSDR